MKLEELVKQYKLKAVCCDMDGVLIDSLGLDLKVVNVLLREIGLSPIAVAFIKANFALSVTDFWTAILVEIGCKPSNPFLPQVVDSYNAVRRKEKIELLPLVRTFLEQTKKLGLAATVVSNNADEEVKQILLKSGIKPYFGFVIGNTQIDYRKPAPDCYLLAAKKLKVEPLHCLVIEDSVIGLQAARAAGIGCVLGVATGGESLEALGIYADLVINDLGELL